MIAVEELRKRWQGVVIPLITPFKGDRSLDLPALESNVQWLIDRGARAGNSVLLAAGSGGDFTSMTVDERKQAIKTVCDVARGRVPVMASGQSTDIRDCIEICQHGEAAGLDAVQLAGHYFYDGRPGDTLAWFQEVAQNTDIGFAVYNHFYSGAHFDMPLDLIDEVLDIPNSIAVKWGAADVAKFMEGVQRFNTRAVVVDNAFLPQISYMLGVRCHISHIPNFYPEHSWGVHELLLAGKYEQAKTEWDRCAQPWLKLTGQVRAQTAAEGVFVRPAMEAAGLKGGHSRPPSRDEVVTPELREGYERMLAEFQA